MEKNNFMNVNDLNDVKEISMSELKLIFHGSVLRKVVINRMMQNTKPETPSLPRSAMVESLHAHP